VVWLAPRALRNGAPAAPWAGASGRPLNFTVRRTLRGDKRREELRARASFVSAMESAATDSIVLQASSLDALGVRVRRWTSLEVGARAKMHFASRRRWVWPRGRFG